MKHKRKADACSNERGHIHVDVQLPPLVPPLPPTLAAAPAPASGILEGEYLASRKLILAGNYYASRGFFGLISKVMEVI
jgi:hypothetical protein